MADYYYAHTRTEHPDAANFERHCHTEYELLFVLHGHGDFIVEGTRYPLRDGTLLLTRPQEYHYVRPDSDTPYERYVINFDQSFAVGAVAELPILFPAQAPGNGIYSSSENVILPLRQICPVTDRLADASPDVRLAATRATVTQALLVLFFHGPYRDSGSGDKTVSAAIDYINSHLTEELSLDRLSDVLYTSKYHLCRIFRDHTGTPILQYINTKRMALASQWLSEGVPAGEVALRLGFRDYSAFYRRFLRICGRSPAKGKRP